MFGWKNQLLLVKFFKKIDFFGPNPPFTVWIGKKKWKILDLPQLVVFEPDIDSDHFFIKKYLIRPIFWRGALKKINFLRFHAP